MTGPSAPFSDANPHASASSPGGERRIERSVETALSSNTQARAALLLFVRSGRAEVDRQRARLRLNAGATPIVVGRSLAGSSSGCPIRTRRIRAAARLTARVSGVGWVRLANHHASGGRRRRRAGARLRSLPRSGGAARVPPGSAQAQLSRPRRNRSRCRRDHDQARDWFTCMGIVVVAIQLEPAS